MKGLRRSQHHQRRKETQPQTSEPDSGVPRSRSSPWSPWTLASNGAYYWSSMRQPDGELHPRSGRRSEIYIYQTSHP
jgi:hypothetical protein